jgi:pSer/pThr/pTyr-binding forkhead associated (FHA) protein/membrane protease subunit (stomatin/prohibitin family)
MSVVICATCGKQNADHLVFCEDCGARLQPRIAPPTPPIGVPQPAIHVGPTSIIPNAEQTKCPRCGSQNAPGMRFCITCGSPLAAPIAPTPMTAPAPVMPAPVTPSPGVAPVVISSPQAAAPAETRTCKRCQGTSDKNAQFCRFCGASLNESIAPPQARSADPSMLPIPLSVPRPAEPRLDATLITPGPSEKPAANVTQGRLVIVHKDGGEGESFPLRDQTDIGREAGECIFADDRYMAPRHARLTRKDGKLFIRDLGSPNGVFVRLRKDDSPNSGVLLEDQDLILLGQQVLRFEIVKDAEAGFGAASEQGTLVFGTPVTPRYARLSQRTTEGVSCDVFHVRKPETVLGRESGDVVFPDDPFMSRRHAAVRVAEASLRTFRLTDLGSSNGTFVRIRGEVPLAHGDEFRVGQQLLRVDLSTNSGASV